jgi:hypothetical protein
VVLLITTPRDADASARPSSLPLFLLVHPSCERRDERMRYATQRIAAGPFVSPDETVLCATPRTALRGGARDGRRVRGSQTDALDERPRDLRTWRSAWSPPYLASAAAV